MKAYDWQKKAVQRFKDAKAFMLNVCCGGGKTFAAILIALEKKLPVIVIAPKTICNQWKDDLIANGVAEKDIFVYNQPMYSKDKMKYENEVRIWLNA